MRWYCVHVLIIRHMAELYRRWPIAYSLDTSPVLASSKLLVVPTYYYYVSASFFGLVVPAFDKKTVAILFPSRDSPFFDTSSFYRQPTCM